MTSLSLPSRVSSAYPHVKQVKGERKDIQAEIPLLQAEIPVMLDRKHNPSVTKEVPKEEGGGALWYCKCLISIKLSTVTGEIAKKCPQSPLAMQCPTCLAT